MTSDLESAMLVAAVFVVLAGIAAYSVFLRTLEGALKLCAALGAAARALLVVALPAWQMRDVPAREVCL